MSETGGYDSNGGDEYCIFDGQRPVIVTETTLFESYSTVTLCPGMHKRSSAHILYKRIKNEHRGY